MRKGPEIGWRWGWRDREMRNPSADALTLQGFQAEKVSLRSRKLRGSASSLGQITEFPWATAFYL